MDFVHAYENYLTKVKKSSGNTVASYLRDIRQFEQWATDECNRGLLHIAKEDIHRYLQHMYSVGKSGATISRSAASIKNFYAYLISTGFIRSIL